MNLAIKVVAASILMTTVSSLVAHAAVDNRAQTSYYVAPAPQPAEQIKYPLESTTAPAAIVPYLQSSATSRITRWYWAPKQVDHQTMMVYGGWNGNTLINRLEFSNGLYFRQYVMHYDTLSSGLQRVTVDCFSSQNSYEGRVEYISSTLNNKTYLAKAIHYGPANNKIYELAVHWSNLGVTATLGREDINLKACQDWLPQHFPMWMHFGLKLN